MIDRVNIIGVPISAVNLQSALSYIFNNLSLAQGKYICVSNVHTTVMAHDDPEYWAVQAHSFLSIPDGKPLSLVGKKTHPEMGQVRGVDLMRAIFQLSTEQGLAHYFYGNTKENLNALIKTIQREYPGIRILGYEPSVFRDLNSQEEDKFIQRINAASPDFCWIGLGAPRQEKFCARFAGKTSSLLVGVGGAFNVIAGVVPDAPKWMQRMGLEWVYRLFKEPRRLFMRYFVTNMKFLYYLWSKR